MARPMTPSSASTSRTRWPFPSPPIAGLQDIAPIVRSSGRKKRAGAHSGCRCSRLAACMATTNNYHIVHRVRLRISAEKPNPKCCDARQKAISHSEYRLWTFHVKQGIYLPMQNSKIQDRGFPQYQLLRHTPEARVASRKSSATRPYSTPPRRFEGALVKSAAQMLQRLRQTCPVPRSRDRRRFTKIHQNGRFLANQRQEPIHALARHSRDHS